MCKLRSRGVFGCKIIFLEVHATNSEKFQLLFHKNIGNINMAAVKSCHNVPTMQQCFIQSKHLKHIYMESD